ncbi:hypothetical protein [Flavobacterium sp.]|uniref:hypothetical protein n=1 Tax=Flavobacterium sp. TaxID=239 RepID=UPI003BBC1DF5
MEQNKLETQIKEQLNVREIQPSPMAWDRLDAMLTIVDEKKTKRFSILSFRNIGLAASILLLVSIGLFYFSPKENVNKPEENVAIGNDSNDNNNFNSNDKDKDNSNSKVNNNYNNNPSAIINPEVEVAGTKTRKPQPIVNPLIIQEKEIEFISNEVIAQNQFPKVIEPSQEIKVSNAIKVNALELLAAVDKTTKSNTSLKIKINANSLLSQVD